jgi:dTDP-4-amino-4,6-dideoxygalactose transaminase
MAADVNVESTRELAGLAVRQGVRRFVFGSTCGVYGRGAFEWLDEDSPPNPVSTFARTKLEGERIVLGLAGDHFEPVVARVATMFGVSPRMRFDLAINQIVASAMRLGAIKVMGGGNQWRPFVHVRDAARAFAAMLEADASNVSGRVFNVGDDNANIRISDLASRVASHFDGVQVETPKDDDELRTYRVLFGRIHETLGFVCERSIEDGIAEVRTFIADTGVDPFDEQFFNAWRMKKLLATPVDEGGEPVAARFIPLARPVLGPEEENIIIEAVRSGWLTSGPQLPMFEKSFAETVSARHAVAVCSCTEALRLCMVHLGVKPGDEVITSPMTWASTANTMINAGIRPVLADVYPDTFNMDPAALEAAITPRTRAIMPVHLAGQPCEMDAIRAVAKRHGLPVIEDAAHALGAAYDGVPVGGQAEGLACFSFYAIKNITTMEGGAITTVDPDVARHLTMLASNGMAETAWQRYGRSAVASPAEVVEPGFKARMGNVSAAMGVAQLRKFPSFLAARRRLARMYRAVLGEIDEIELPRVIDNVEHAWHLMMIRLKLDKLDKNRDEIAAELRRENVGTGVHFLGLHLHQYYRENLGYGKQDLPNATMASYSVLSLPLYPGMTDKNVHEVVAALKKVLPHAGKH